MPSILAGYEYDIFISYRQKDNKTGWVTEFVEALRNEIEASFKEDISIYFDSNPHDGLHETHDVDGSLKEKVKCLVFLPIISQTYCDPNSFAWQSEFLPFLDFVKSDPHGLEVRLKGGNVARRVLPVRIHEIDKEDKDLFESQVGGVMRPVDFIHASAGVNRPLRQQDDDTKEITHTVFYRDQINKVAYAIKDIITSMRDGTQTAVAPETRGEVARPVRRRSRSKMALGITLFAVLLFAFYLYAKFSQPFAIDSSKVSIAIIPFLNNTSDEELDWYGLGIANEIRDQFSVSKQFDFISAMQATIGYRNTLKDTKSIGDELGVTHLLTGMYQKQGDYLEIHAEFVEAATGKSLWPITFRTKTKDLFEAKSSIAGMILKRFDAGQVNQKFYETSVEVLAEYNRGAEIWTYELDTKKVIPHFTKALELDSAFFPAWKSLLQASAFYYFNHPYDTFVTVAKLRPVMEYINDHFDDSWQKNECLGIYAYWVEMDYDKGARYFEKVLQENPETETSTSLLRAIYRRQLDYDKALPLAIKSLQMLNNAQMWSEFGHMMFEIGDLKNRELAYQRAYTLNPDYTFIYWDKFSTNQLEELPQELKKRYEKRVVADGLWLNRDYEALSKYLWNVKPDSTFNQLDLLAYKALVSFASVKEDSARIFGKQYLALRKERPNLNITIFNRSFTDVLVMGILGRRPQDFAETFQYLESQLDEDLLGQSTLTWAELLNAVYSKDYENATEKLVLYNQKFPALANYILLDLPDFDRIKKEHPPFNDAINNLKIPIRTQKLDDLAR